MTFQTTKYNISTKMASKRVGYLMSEKKRRRLNLQEFHDICRESSIDLVKVDLSVPLEDQGPFHLILHKLTDQLVQANRGNLDAAHQLETLKHYLEQHPDIVMVDPLENISKLLDRNRQYALVEQTLNQSSKFFSPTFVEITSADVETNKELLYQNRVTFPFVCKPTQAHGSNLSHQMCLIFNEEGLKDVQPPCVAQSFINHNALLYKIFVTGSHYCIVERPSIKNFSPGESGQKTIHFNSHNVSKADSTSFLNTVEQCELDYPLIYPEARLLRDLGHSIQTAFGLDLLGIDVIVENHTGRYAVIDTNSFPGYDGVPGLLEALLQLVQQKLHLKLPCVNGDTSFPPVPPCVFPLPSTPRLFSEVPPYTLPNSTTPPHIHGDPLLTENTITKTYVEVKRGTACRNSDKELLVNNHLLPEEELPLSTPQHNGCKEEEDAR